MTMLTNQERDKFATYLEAVAEDGRALVKQMELLPRTSVLTCAIERLRRDADAFVYVAIALRAVESVTTEGVKT